MYPQIVKDSPGRPTVGSEAKSKMVKFRIEPTLYDELVFACRINGIPISEGIRQAIINYIRIVTTGYR